MVDISGLSNALLWGVATGCIYVLLATGLNIIFGVMKLVNFAHGQLLMLGAYIALGASAVFGINEMLRASGLSIYLSIIVAVLIVALVGFVLERLTFRRVRGADKLNEIFISLGLIFVFENTVILWKGFGLQQIVSPFQGLKLSLGDTSISYDWLFAVFVVIIILLGLLFLMKKTRLGLAIKATSQKVDTAMLMGINVEKIYVFTFALGAALAGVAGALYGMLFSFDPSIGTFPTIKAFAIIILGGFGSIPGAVIGGLIYGIAENVAVFFLGGIWRDAIAFAVLIAVLILRPSGLFGEKGE
ncbi:MAG: branched-chain amino acid ABC transporter permease [Crenarchaeota archaeon]|nr:branched-chain amino acid ABC transporter permease [Thermoproteota archaeon]